MTATFDPLKLGPVLRPLYHEILHLLADGRPLQISEVIDHLAFWCSAHPGTARQLIREMLNAGILIDRRNSKGHVTTIRLHPALHDSSWVRRMLNA